MNGKESKEGGKRIQRNRRLGRKEVKIDLNELEGREVGSGSGGVMGWINSSKCHFVTSDHYLRV